VIVLVVAFFPLLLFRGSPPERPPSDQDDGWGNGPSRPPPIPPDASPGGMPPRDAEPARVRLRSRDRLANHVPVRARRPAREPDRKPARR
jgi:hypothetical protein